MKATITTLILVAALLGAAASQAGTWRVEQDGSGDFTTLQPAVDAAASGDTILIGPGDYVDMAMAVTEYGYEIEVFAYWNEAKDLVIAGAGSDVVRFGPEEYTPSSSAPSPSGIISEHPNRLVVRGVAFRNLYWSIVNISDTDVTGCTFETGYIGLRRDGGGGKIAGCRFANFHYACQYFACDTVVVRECTLENARVYFGQTTCGVVEDCTIEGGGWQTITNPGAE